MILICYDKDMASVLRYGQYVFSDIPTGSVHVPCVIHSGTLYAHLYIRRCLGLVHMFFTSSFLPSTEPLEFYS